MAQLDDMSAAAGVEAEVDTTTPESQGVEQTDTTTNTDAADFYADDAPEQDDADDVEDQADDEAEEPIAAPVSLKAEEKEQFSQLPREAQQALSEILSRRDRETQQGLESARAAQREAQTSAADAIAETQRDFAARTARVIAAFAPKPPPIELARENPGEYQYQKALFDEDAKAYDGLVQQLGGLHEEASGHFTQREQQENQERIRGLLSIPEFANEETRPEFIGKIEKVGTELGYGVQQLAQMDRTDMAALAKVQTFYEKAMKWDAHQKKRNDRPRQAQSGRFAAAPVGARTASQSSGNDAAKLLYPND